MSDLVAIAYPDLATAERVRSRLGEAMQARIIEVDDAVIVTRDQAGKVELQQTGSAAAAGAAGGALWGGLIGLLFLAPLVGMAIGAATGAATGALADYGVDDRFMKELGEKLEPGGAALIVLVRKMTTEGSGEHSGEGSRDPELAEQRRRGAAQRRARRGWKPSLGQDQPPRRTEQDVSRQD